MGGYGKYGSEPDIAFTGTCWLVYVIVFKGWAELTSPVHNFDNLIQDNESSLATTCQFYTTMFLLLTVFMPKRTCKLASSTNVSTALA